MKPPRHVTPPRPPPPPTVPGRAATALAPETAAGRLSCPTCPLGGALQEYRLARELRLPVYRYIAEEIRPMPATMLPVYDMLTEEGRPHAAD